MSKVSFPVNPQENDLFTVNNIIYQYSGGRWKNVSLGSLLSSVTSYINNAVEIAKQIHVSGTAPVTPSIGSLWWDSEDGRLKIYYYDGSSYQWVDTSSAALLSGGGGGTPANQYTLTGTTTNATETEIFVDGVQDSRIALNLDTAIMFEANFIVKGTSDYSAIHLKGSARNLGGTCSDLGSLYEVIVASSNPGIIVDVRADNTNKTLNVYVAGLAGKTLDFKAVINIVEV